MTTIEGTILTPPGQFTCRLDRFGPWRAVATVPPDSAFIAAVITGLPLINFTITGLHTDAVTVDAHGASAAMRLQAVFRKTYPWGYECDHGEIERGEEV